MIVVMGASGNTGGRICEQLLQQSEQIRALGRCAAKLAGLGSKGAKVLTGDATDAVFLTSAFRDADAVYTLSPPDPQSRTSARNGDEEGEAIVKAIRVSGVRHVVFLSSIGADLPEGTGPVVGLALRDRMTVPAGWSMSMLVSMGLVRFDEFCVRQIAHERRSWRRQSSAHGQGRDKPGTA